MAWQVEKTAEGVRFRVRVVPRARKNEVSGVVGNALKVRLTAAPVEGAANRALVAFLARQLGVRRAQVRIVSGQTARQKLIAVEGVGIQPVRERLLPKGTCQIHCQSV